MTKEQEELNKEIEEAGRKIFKNGTGQDTRYDYLQELRREGFMEGALQALTNESIYSKARLVKVDNSAPKVTCANCGSDCKIVRPGKYQCPQCD